MNKVKESHTGSSSTSSSQLTVQSSDKWHRQSFTHPIFLLSQKNTRNEIQQNYSPPVPKTIPCPNWHETITPCHPSSGNDSVDDRWVRWWLLVQLRHTDRDRGCGEEEREGEEERVFHTVSFVQLLTELWWVESSFRCEWIVRRWGCCAVNRLWYLFSCVFVSYFCKS